MTVRQQIGRSAENIDAIHTFVANDLNLRIALTTLWGIFREDIDLHPFKDQPDSRIEATQHTIQSVY